MIQLGGPTARKVITKGDLCCAFHYVNGEETACFYPNPAMRTMDVGNKHRPGAYLVPLSHLHKFDDRGRAGDLALVEAAAIAARIMGFTAHSKNDVLRIARFMNEMFGELYYMKPKPDSLRDATEPLMRLDDLKIEHRDGVTRVHMEVTG
jgi:hypothetical protein